MEFTMKVLVIGLGSMGKRRIRNLKAIGGHVVAGFDLRDDRCSESSEKYGIDTFCDLDSSLKCFHPDALIISTSPAYHMDYAFMGFELGLPCFVEASVVEAERILELHLASHQSKVLIAPSCTMRHFPGPKKIKELLQKGTIGKPLNFNYQTGQYLPDWHPWEKIEDYYVSKRETGAGREIVPFELTWLNDIFGEPKPLACVKAKVTDMNADIDDIYHSLLRYPEGVLANITVEVVSRPQATREMRVLGSSGVIVYSADENCVRYCNNKNQDWVRFELYAGTHEESYISPEEPYIEELRSFLKAVSENNKNLYPNTLIDDYNILRTLGKLEDLSESIKN
jgi:predicted dehydrogenase